MTDVPAELREAAQRYLEAMNKKNMFEPSYNKRTDAKLAFESAKEELLLRLCTWLTSQKP